MGAISKQSRITHEGFGKLLGIGGTDIDQMIKHRTQAEARWLQKIAKPEEEQTREDQIRLEGAEARRQRQNVKRARNYARCIGGNWGKTLTEHEHMATARVANKLSVDKAFVVLNRNM
jgi:hypothetical protein